jgi:hypothetical protein
MIPVNLFTLGAQAGPKSYDVREHHCRCDPTVASLAPLAKAFAEVPMLYCTDVELAYHEDQGRDTRPIFQSVWSDRRWGTTWSIAPSIAVTTLPEEFKKTIWVARRPGRHGRGKTVNRFRYASITILAQALGRFGRQVTFPGQVPSKPFDVVDFRTIHIGDRLVTASVMQIERLSPSHPAGRFVAADESILNQTEVAIDADDHPTLEYSMSSSGAASGRQLAAHGDRVDGRSSCAFHRKCTLSPGLLFPLCDEHHRIFSVLWPRILRHHGDTVRAVEAEQTWRKNSSSDPIRNFTWIKPSADGLRKVERIQHYYGKYDIWTIDVEFAQPQRALPIPYALTVRNAKTNEIILSTPIDYGGIRVRVLEEKLAARQHSQGSDLILGCSTTILQIGTPRMASPRDQALLRSANISSMQALTATHTASSLGAQPSTLLCLVEHYLDTACSSTTLHMTLSDL